MATEGPNSSTVGSINVAVGADLSGLQSKLAQAEAATKASAAKMAATMAAPVGDKSAAMGGAAGFGMGKGPGVSGIGGSPAAAAAAASVAGEKAGRSWVDGFRKGSRDFKFILGGFGLVGAVSVLQRMYLLGKQIGEAIFNADRHAREFAATLNSIKAPQIEATTAAIVRMREALGQITAIEAERRRTLAAIRAEEEKLNAEYLKRIEFLDTMGGLWEGITRGMDRAALTAEADKKRLATLKEITDRLNQQLKAEEAIVRAKEEQERIERRIREQAKRDITHTTIDASRLGPARDLLQLQRSAI